MERVENKSSNIFKMFLKFQKWSASLQIFKFQISTCPTSVMSRTSPDVSSVHIQNRWYVTYLFSTLPAKPIKWSQIFSYNPQPKTPKPQNPKNQIELDKYFDFQKISSQMSRANFSTQSWPECLQNFEKLSGHDQVQKFALCIWLKIISQLRNLSSN